MLGMKGSHLGRAWRSIPTGGGWARARHLTTEDVCREVLPVLRIIVCEAWVVAPQGATPGATLLLGASTPTRGAFRDATGDPRCRDTPSFYTCLLSLFLKPGLRIYQNTSPSKEGGPWHAAFPATVRQSWQSFVPTAVVLFLREASEPMFEST